MIGCILVEKAKLIKCSNPKCKREISEPIIVNDFSNKSMRTFSGCPNCLFEVDVATFQIQKGKQKTTVEHEETNSLRCTHNIGYLTSRLQQNQIPQECLVCTNLLECMQKT